MESFCLGTVENNKLKQRTKYFYHTAESLLRAIDMLNPEELKNAKIIEVSHKRKTSDEDYSQYGGYFISKYKVEKEFDFSDYLDFFEHLCWTRSYEKDKKKILPFIISSTDFNEEILSNLLLKFSTEEMVYIIENVPAIVDELRKELLDLIIKDRIDTNFKKLIVIEKASVMATINSQSKDSELPALNFKKEYFRALSKYFAFKDVGFSIELLKELQKEGILTKEQIIDIGYVCNCSENVKFCSLILKSLK